MERTKFFGLQVLTLGLAALFCGAAFVAYGDSDDNAPAPPQQEQDGPGRHGFMPGMPIDPNSPQSGNNYRPPPPPFVFNMTQEQRDAIRHLPPDQAREEVRKLYQKARNDWNERSGVGQQGQRDTNPMALVRSYSSQGDVVDLDAAWRRLTDEQRLKLSDWSPLERLQFRKSLRGYLLAPDSVTTAAREKIEEFLTPSQVQAITNMTEEQHKDAVQMIDKYTSTVLLQRAVAKLPEEQRNELIRLALKDKRDYLLSHGIDPELINVMYSSQEEDEKTSDIETPKPALGQNDSLSTAVPEAQ